MAQERSQAGMEKIGRNLSLIALVVLLAIVPFETRFGALYQSAEVAILLGVLLRLFWQARWQFWAMAGAVFVGSIAFFMGLAWICTRATQSPFTTAEIAKTLLTQVGALYFFMVVVFVGQFIFRPETWAPHDRWTRFILALVWVFGLIVLLSAICSLNPLESLPYVRKYLAPYVLIYMIAVETLHSWRHYRIIITTIYLVGIIVTSASVATRYLYIYGGYDLKSDFQKSGILREEQLPDREVDPATYGLSEEDLKRLGTGIPLAHQGLYPMFLPDGKMIVVKKGAVELRNQWPFAHHNRLCSYALLVTLFVWLQFFVTRNWELKTLVAISTIIPVWCMIVTLTRGGWIALAVGALALVLLINWRSVWVVLAIVFAAWLVSPAVVRERLATVLRPSTYTKSEGTFHLRIHLWGWALDIIRKYPVLGLGAGWELFEDYVKSHYPLVEPDMATSNAHNNFLEIAAESGIPAAVVFLAFTVALFAQIVRAWRTTGRQTKRRFVTAGFFALLISTTVYGLSSYSLRYTMGMLVWICFALMTLLPTIARAIPEEPGSAPATPAATGK